jgi:hypothetical protein
MPLNKLENFIKNTEGRILYVNPNDLDATDGVENQGNSLTKPFKTIQRALLESARFSYLRGNDNDIVEKTTILVFPGEHLIDNRPGYAIKNVNGVATAVSPGGVDSFAGNELTLTLNTNFDLTQEDNILYKFNSINGGIIIPRGTSIVGLDLRKTKVRPKYVPNPTDSNVPSSAIFRITGACYFWQFTFFDGNDSGLVYTDPINFSVNNRSKPTFSHHKLTCFEYADGVNIPAGYDITDLDMYYSKISNAFNRASGREIDQKYPAQGNSFAKQRPEWEIVGAFATDPITITSIISGDGATPGTVVTVTTQTEHGLTAGTPIKIRGINVNDYNISTKVVQVLNDTTFTYALSFVRANLPAGPAAGLAPGASANVTIETDTVSGASPYIFNVSLRSVYGMNGMHADGSKASGFRSMVVAQFTAVSLQKDDRAFVKYNASNRTYDSIAITPVTGAALASGSSSTNQASVYHLDSDAIYRNGWQTTHIKMSNDAVIQIVSVFAIGFHKHFVAESGGDASITNSNSNFGQFSLAAEGFKAAAFSKDDKGFITSIISPRSIVGEDVNIEWVQFDVTKTKAVNINNHIYLLGYTSQDIPPPVISQGYRIGAKLNDKLYVDSNDNSGTILMTNGPITVSNTAASGDDSSAKIYTASLSNTGNGTVYTISGGHALKNGESIRIISETGDLPENIENNTVYYAITRQKKATLGVSEIQIASSRTNAEAQIPIYITSYGGDQLRIESRVSDKEAGELGHPIQWDSNQGQWFIHTQANSALWQYIQSLSTDETEISYLLRKEDDRSLDEKLYKVRYVIPKELVNGREPVNGFVLQDSASTNVRQTSDFTLTDIDTTDYDFDRNTRFITLCTFDSGPALITVRSDKNHDLKVGDKVIVNNVTSTTNTGGKSNLGFNGTFIVNSVVDGKTFTVSNTDVFGKVHNTGTFTNDINVRDNSLPRFTRNDVQKNYYVYRTETITPYIYNIQDGVYYLYVLNSGNEVPIEFNDFKYSQKVTDLYPQLDRDNENDNPEASKTFTKRFPIGDVITNDLKRSLTRETVDQLFDTFSHGNKISSVSDSGTSATLVFENDHKMNGLKEYTSLNGGTGHTDGTYYNVRLFNNNAAPASAVWDGATAKVIVSGGAVTSAEITEQGSGYTDGETLYFDSSTIGGTPQANVTINTAGISTAEGNYAQITGIGTTAGGYFRITNASNKSSISIAKTTGDPLVVSGQYAINLGQAVTIEQTAYNSTSKIATYQSLSSPHGLLAGNSFRILDNSDNNLGDYIVNSVSGTNEFTAKVSKSLSDSRYVLKHGMSANNASADNLGENLGVRGITVYDNEVLILGETLSTQDQFEVELPGAGIGTMARFPLGSYIQIDNEIMRIKSDSLTGTSSNEIKVIRGSMGTIIEPHTNGSLIKKIKLTPIEFRRPSILRASGHTFEYLGYGPGNYSTGLPQVQVKTLSEKEEFLAQSQETACGTVLYTGMDSDGDFYIGNTKYSAQSGEQTTFDVPTPTITGEDPNRLSVVFDEVIVKERVLIEGGNSGQILSQFDGPVTFNGDVRLNGQLALNNELRVTGKVDFRNENDATSCTDSNAALRIFGGVGIAKRLYVCGGVTLSDNLSVSGITTISSFLDVNDRAEIDNIRIDENTIDTTSGNLTLDSNGGILDINDNVDISGNVDIDDTTQSTSTTTGALKVDGGVGIAKNINVGGNADVTGNLVVDGNVTLGDSGSDTLTVDAASTFNDSVFINAANEFFYIRNGSDSTNRFIVDTDNGNTTINGSLTVQGAVDFNGYLDIDNIRLNGNTVSTTSGNLVLNSTGGTIDINDNVDISGTLVVAGNSTLGNATSDVTLVNGNLRVTRDIIAFYSSDERLKDNITPIEDPLAKVLSISGNTYDWNENSNNDGADTGVIAQEVEALGLPGVVTTREDGYKAVRYDRLVPLLIEAIKELSTKVSDLEDRLNK